MNTALLIKKQLKKTGTTVCLEDDGWTSMPFEARLDFLWRKKSSAFEPNYTELGVVDAEYYLYIGPADHNILVLSGNAVLVCDGVRYVFNRKDAVKLGDEVIYYSGILSRVKGEEYEGY